MDQSSSESQQNGPYRERTNRSPPQVGYLTQQKSPRERPSQFLSQGPPSSINRPSQLLSRAQYQTPVQGRNFEEQGSQPRNSMIRQRFQSDEFEMEDDLLGYVEDYNVRLNMIFQQLNNNPIGAIELIEQLMEEYQEDKLRVINNSGNLDQELIRLIYQVLQRLDNSLTSNTIRVILSQARNEWQIQQMDIGQKVLEDLTIEKSKCGKYLLTLFVQPTELWKKALQNQQFEKLPETILKYIIEEYPFEFVMDCLLSHHSATYSQNVADRIWNTILSDEIQERDKYQLMQNIAWLLELTGKSQNYQRDFMKKGLLNLLVIIFIKCLGDSTEYVELITKHIGQLLILGLPNLLTEIQRSGLMLLYTQNIQEAQLTEAGYQSLQRLQQNIAMQYRDQLRSILPHSEWYQQILLKMFTQTDNEKISFHAQKELKKWLQSEDKKYFLNFLGERYDYLGAELQLRIDKIMP